MLRLVTIDLRNADLALFDAYEAKVLPLAAKHGGRLEIRVRAVDGGSETHLLRFPDEAAFEAYRNDPQRLAVRDMWERCGAVATAVEVEAIPR